MLQKLIMSAVALTMIFVFSASDAGARVKDCGKCERTRIHKVRCPKPKCVTAHHHDCSQSHVSSCSSCSAGSPVSEIQILSPVADPGPMTHNVDTRIIEQAPVDSAPAPAPAPVEAAPSPSAGDAIQ